MKSPELISIFSRLLFDSCLADRADYDVELVSVTSHFAPMVVWSSVLTAENLPTVLALERHEVTLVTLRQFAMLSDLGF